MSGFLYRTTPVITPLLRQPLAISSRAFTTTLQPRKSATETVKDGLKAVDRTVSDAAVKGLDKGQEAADAVKSVAGVKAGEAEGTAQELAGKAKGKAAELEGKAKGTAEEVKGKM